MDTQIPTSFIPKRPVSTEPVAPKVQSRAVGIVSLLAVVSVIATGLSFGGVYLYEKQLTAQKIKADTEINDARKGIGTDFLSDMKRLDARIAGVSMLLRRHIVVTPTGSAKNYSTIALQSDAFGKSPLIKNPIFSNLTVDDKTNAVNFKLVFSVSPSALSYEALIGGSKQTL